MVNSVSRETVLVVEENQDDLNVFIEVLTSEGLNVIALADKTEAFALAQRCRPALILIGIQYCVEFCNRLREDGLTEEIPILAIGAADESSFQQNAISAGAIDFICKPLNRLQILMRVKTHLQISAQINEYKAHSSELHKQLGLLHQCELQRELAVQMLVHDMRSPLMGMVGNLEILRQMLKKTQNDECEEILDEVLAAGYHLREMMSTVLDISRMESKQMPLNLEDWCLQDIIHMAIGSLGSLVDKSRFSCTVPEKSIFIECDFDLVRRTIENLLTNAFKYSGEHGKVLVAVSSTPGLCKLSISDTGPGIPEMYQKIIFEKFGQIKAWKEGRSYSSGLGLTFCKLVAEIHGGKIGLESQINQGSTFWIELPRKY